MEQQSLIGKTTKPDPFLAQLETANDLVPAGRERPQVTINGNSYDGIVDVPLEELALCSKADYKAMLPAHRSHRTRLLREAARKGKFSPEAVAAMQEKGVLPKEL